MLTEDEFILELPFKSAADVLLTFSHVDGRWSAKTRALVRSDLRRMCRQSKILSLNAGICMVFAVEVNEKLEGTPLFDKLNRGCLRLYDEQCGMESHVGVVAYTTRGDLNIELGVKGNNIERQRANINLATTSTNDRMNPALPYAVQMVVDSAASTENDSFVLLITDGESWDPLTYRNAKNLIERVNKERDTRMHIFVLGLEMEEQEILEECRQLGAVTKKSFYMDVTLSNVESAFNLILATICGHSDRSECIQALTMQRF